ncbi:MAG: hypothetical protein LBV48_01395 [Mycoplasmataceae bacterium]|nr:hypothetical protein [Mycoplasmataceae bacterium]
MQENYYINEIAYNPINKNKYIYVDSFDGNIELENNKWKFDLNFYLIYNGTLPSNIFLLDFALPFTERENIQINLVHPSYIPHFVTQKDLCNMYHVTFYLDVPEKLIVDEVTIYNVLLKSRFSINSSVLENTDIKSNPTVINEFATEIISEEEKATFEFLNTINLNNKSMASCQLCTNIYINSKEESFYIDDGIFFEDISSENEGIKKYIKILSEKNLIIKKIRWDFKYYVTDDQIQHHYQFEEAVDKVIDDEYDIAFDKKTLFNFSTHTLENDKNGVDGIYIPIASEGLLNASITLVDNKNNTRYANISKDIKFLGNDSDEKYISKKDKDFTIDNTFTKEKYYD